MGEIIVVLLAVGITVATAKARSSARCSPLEAALSPFGLRQVRARAVADFLLPSPLFSLNALTYEGRIDGLRLIVQTQVRFVDRQGNNLGNFVSRQELGSARQVHFVRLVIDSDGRIPKTFALHLHFGHDFNVLGDEKLAAALLDGELRSITGRGDELSIEDGRLVFESPFLVQRDPRAALLGLGRMLQRLQGVLDGSVTIDRLLEQNLDHDDDPTVRARAVELLLQSSDSDLARATMEKALADHEPEVRLTAARFLKEDGFEVIAEIIRTELLHENVQQRGLRYLVRTFPSERVRAILAIALGSQSERLQATAVQLINELGPASPVASELLRVEPRSYFNATLLAEALGHVGGGAAEAALIRLLYFKAKTGLMLDLDMRIAVADALGRVGSLAAVKHLHPYAEGPLHDENLRLAATTAIELIGSRCGGMTGGGALSLIEGPSKDQGKLSVANNGHVSVPEE